MDKLSVGATLGILSSIAYFKISESTVPKDSNCSYLAPASTDILANAAAIILLLRAQKAQDPYVAFIGSCIGGIHTQQWLKHKRSGQQDTLRQKASVL